MNTVGKKPQIKITLAILAVLLVNALLVAAQTSDNRSAASDAPLDGATRAAIIEGALKHLNDAYVFPEVAKKMEAAIRERLQRREYDSITNPALLVTTLTQHLREVSHDKHLRVAYNPAGFPVAKEPSKEALEKMRAIASQQNFGFQKVERLDGNVGYLDLRGFPDTSWAADTAAA